MTPDKFKSIVHAAVEKRNPHLSSFGDRDLNAVARDYSRGDIDISAAIERLAKIYKENRDIDRHDFDEITKRLERA